jgi:tetratricopeptide (TPR) repeat protein
LVVALAREAGLQAYFVWTTEVEEFKEDNFLKIAERHLAAAYGPAPSMTVLDFRGLTEADPRRFRVIPDRTAAAIFHSNRGVEELLAEQTKAALTWLEAAVQLDPDLAVAWLNLGVGLRHAGDVNAAKRAYRHALEISPNLPWARKNLAFLLQFHSGRN